MSADPAAIECDGDDAPGSSPLVSVALATYNGERYLEELLCSIEAQDYPNMEINPAGVPAR